MRRILKSIVYVEDGSRTVLKRNSIANLINKMLDVFCKSACIQTGAREYAYKALAGKKAFLVTRHVFIINYR